VTTRTVNRNRGRQVDGWLASAVARLLERDCRLCRARIRAGSALCQPCHDALPWLSAGCTRCADPRSAGYECGECQRQPPAFDRIVTAFAYRDEVASLVRRFKHGGDLSAGRVLADALASRTPDDLPPTLVPVPLDRWRLRERGFNQATEIARRLPGRVEGSLVVRTGARQPQSLLAARQRRRNIRHAFRLTTAGAHRVPARITIIDDVVTTGATVRELARLLARAGAREIAVCALARA
jgi:ComF family protein